MSALASAALAQPPAEPPGRTDFTRDWRFEKIGPLTDGSTFLPPDKALEMLVSPEFNDASWRRLDLPHDWGIEGPVRDELDNETGKRPWRGIGWYRKHFNIPAADQGKRIFIDFDGAMANAKVWLNGREVGTWPYGYNAFRLELTPFVKFGADNVLAVQLDTVQWGSRWYPGAGIYRNVWLVKTAPVHIGHWGVCVTTPAITDERAEAKLAVTVDNQGEQAATVNVRAEIFEARPDGSVGAKVASTAAVERQIAAGASSKLDLTTVLAKPKRWDLASPHRYVARVAVQVNGRTMDLYDQAFGFRTLEFTPRDGFKLNGRHVPLRGVCLHHDLGPLGAAFNTRAAERQLEILKEMGCNALRTAHNPPAPEVLELCDRMGILVVAEAFDTWSESKRGNDYARLFKEWHAKDLQALVRRERNHPSVIMWSIGNEVAEQGRPPAAKVLRDIVNAEDPTRPVTAGCDGGASGTNGFQHAVDVFGINYHTDTYEGFFKFSGNGNKAVFASETASCLSSRGEYFFPVRQGEESRLNFQVSSYDVDTPGCGSSPDAFFAALDKFPAVMGEFVWTGFDYLGESYPYDSDIRNRSEKYREGVRKDLLAMGKLNSPAAISYFGILDHCGFKKDRFYAYQARWRPDLPMAHVFPHWNWPERVGQVTPVHVYTSGDEAELFLNGKSLGRKKKGHFEYRLRWDDVVYQPGELKVVAYKGGKEWAHEVVRTTGAAAKVRLTVDRAKITADGRDLAFVTVSIVDKDGQVVPRSHDLVRFDLTGPGEIVAIGNGNSADPDSFQATQRRAFNGLCQVIVRGRPGQPGSLTLTAGSDALGAASIAIQTKP